MILQNQIDKIKYRIDNYENLVEKIKDINSSRNKDVSVPSNSKSKEVEISDSKTKSKKKTK